MNAQNKKYSSISVKEKLDIMASWIEEKKGMELVSFDLQGLNSISEGVLIASATSMRHAQGLADHVLSMCKASSFEYFRMEGYQTGQWILLDCNDVLVNIFQEDARKEYKLEDLWPREKKYADKRSSDSI